MRHAIATHNEKLFNTGLDTDLTEEGKIYASGNIFNALMNDNNAPFKNANINYFFASPLRRTRQTITAFMDRYMENKKIKTTLDLIILPYSYEIKEPKESKESKEPTEPKETNKKQSNGDDNCIIPWKTLTETSLLHMIRRENKVGCDANSINDCKQQGVIDSENSKKYMCCNIGNIKVNWNYQQDEENKKNGKTSSDENPVHQNMLYHMLKIIGLEENLKTKIKGGYYNKNEYLTNKHNYLEILKIASK